LVTVVFNRRGALKLDPLRYFETSLTIYPVSDELNLQQH